MAVVTPLNNFLGPEGDTVTVDEQLLNTEYWWVGGECSVRDWHSGSCFSASLMPPQTRTFQRMFPLREKGSFIRNAKHAKGT